MMPEKKRFILLLAGLFMFALAACSPLQVSTPAKNHPPLKIAATFYPLSFFANQIGGDRAQVYTLVPPGSEPHDWEPTARDVFTIRDAGIFLYNGAGLEPWIETILTSLPPDAEVLEATKGIQLLPAAGTQPGSGFDPHVWLDPNLAVTVVENIVKIMTRVDPAGEDYYKARGDVLVAKLRKLDKDYRLSLASFRGKEIVTSHAAFAYLTKRYGLKEHPVLGLSPEVEPGARELAALITLIKEKHIEVIFVEPLIQPKTLDAITRETGAQTLFLNPLEGLTPLEQQNGKDYLSVMLENLRNLEEALARQD